MHRLVRDFAGHVCRIVGGLMSWLISVKGGKVRD